MSGIEPVAREDRLAAAFIELADTLVDDFDIMDFLHTLTDHAVRLLEVDAAGVLLVDLRGQMIDATASDETTRRLELAQIQWEEGPCRDCARSGVPVADTSLDDAVAQQRWPRFTRHAIELGFTAVAGVPLRLRTQVVGALNLFHRRPGALGVGDLRLAQALADAATIGLLQQRAVHDRTTLTTQLQGALYSRITIEQAKGILAERTGLSMDEVFRRLRGYARRNGRLLTDLADAVIDGSAEAEEFTTSPEELA